ncbi:MAG: response regulator [Magnetococcus sp. XQGC-1]
MKYTILAVDDSPENLEVLKHLLVPQYLLRGAIDGSIALKIVASHPPDLILLDIMMPGMDGYEVCRQLQMDPVTSNIPVIFLTSQDTFQDEAKGLMLGAADFLMKPIDPKQLLTRIRVQLSRVARWKEREAVLLAKIANLEAELARLKRQ